MQYEEINKMKPDRKKEKTETCVKFTQKVDDKVNDNLSENQVLTLAVPVIPMRQSSGGYGILPNGLINSVKHYIILSTSEYVKIGIFKPKINVPLVLKEFQMAAKQFYPIANTRRWIDSIIIGCFIATHMDEWVDKNISYMPTDIANKAIGTFAAEKKRSNSDIYKIFSPLNDVLLMPYVFEGHCALLIVNIKEETLTVMDPYEVSCDQERVVTALHTYVKSCKPPCTLSDLKHLNWRETSMTNRPYQSKADTTNCTVYVMYYILCIGRRTHFDLEFDPVEFRTTVAETLIARSDNITNRCMYCFSAHKNYGKKNANQEKICPSCNRWMHISCAMQGDVDTEDEKKVKLKTFSRKRKCIPSVKESVAETFISRDDFQCKLCNRQRNQY